MRVCSEHTAEGTIWPVDAALRPEGKSGPLVRTLASHQGYYEKWAKTWEFQALLKARPVAGDADLGREYVERITPMVWEASQREGFVTDVQAMRRRVIENIPAAHADRQIKLGAGGLRDVEFAVQLLQMVHGRADPAVRAPATLSALAYLTRAGYVGREDGAALDDAYRFLRTLEHRMQLYKLTRVHVVPEDQESLRRLGRSMGMTRRPGRRAREGVAASQPRGPAAAREALLPSAAHRGRQAADRRGPAVPGVGQAAACRRSATRTRSPRCATWRRSPQGVSRIVEHPAGAAAGDAGLVR